MTQWGAGVSALALLAASSVAHGQSVPGVDIADEADILVTARARSCIAHKKRP